MEDIKQAVAGALETIVREKYEAAPGMIAVEYPPRPGMGDLATPVAFELAKRLRRPPRQIAQELAASFPALPGVLRVEAGGAGYGVCPGDHHFPEPYAYVLPPKPQTGPFWNAPFGAARLMRDLDNARPDAVLAFFTEGRGHAA